MYGDDEGEIGILSTGMPEKSDISLVTCLGISLEEEIRRLRAALSASRPSREEEMRERAKVREECAQILRDDAETLERNGMAQKAHGLKRGALLILELNTQERAALAQGGARDEAPKDEGKEGAK
jgi:uncharacterized membrane protein